MGAAEAARLRPVTPEDFSAILALNEASVAVLAPLSRDRLAWLHSRASYHQVVVDERGIGGVLLAFRAATGHDSSNFLWFAQRLGQFVYVDRVIIAADRRRLGLGSRLYEDLFTVAREERWGPVTCEIDADPPNPESERFHERLGFVEIGTQVVEHEAGHPKRVSLRRLDLYAPVR